jgi:hypothetical protein
MARSPPAAPESHAGKARDRHHPFFIDATYSQEWLIATSDRKGATGPVPVSRAECPLSVPVKGPSPERAVASETRRLRTLPLVCPVA